MAPAQDAAQAVQGPGKAIPAQEKPAPAPAGQGPGPDDRPSGAATIERETSDFLSTPYQDFMKYHRELSLEKRIEYIRYSLMVKKELVFLPGTGTQERLIPGWIVQQNGAVIKLTKKETGGNKPFEAGPTDWIDAAALGYDPGPDSPLREDEYPDQF